MTTSEAIELLEMQKDIYDGGRMSEALQMAIDALKKETE